ncbi:MAG: class A beta-lactamase [Erythrobacter sp.]|nr:class A beta-lactamase [Erythrobacter sp.]
MTIQRRTFVGGSIALCAAACVPVDRTVLGRLDARLRIIEAAGDGTLGVQIFDTDNGETLGINTNRRFGHCSSFKLSLAAMVLALDASGAIDADRRVTWTEDELLFVSPFTAERQAAGASLRELAEATQKFSDNTAANVLLRELGGPSALTEFWREIGDPASRLDRTEPGLNNVPETEIRDTTTPAAMARTVAKLVFGDVLEEDDRATLKRWMAETATGAKRVRAGLPREWSTGDKTGTSIWPGMGSLYVDIGFVEPPNRAPLTFATYFRSRETHDGIDPASEATLAKIGDVIADFAEVDDGFPF